jgi:hypothetical protein
MWLPANEQTNDPAGDGKQILLQYADIGRAYSRLNQHSRPISPICGLRFQQFDQKLTPGVANAEYDRLFYPFQAENMAFVKLSLNEFGQQDPHGFAGTA